MLGSALLLSSPLLGALVGIVGAQAIADAEPSCEALVETLVRERGIAPGAAALVRASLERHGGVVVRWSSERLPLEVWVQPRRALFGADPASPAEWTWAVLSGMARWQGLAPGIALRRTDDSSSADVHVTWVRAIQPRAQRSVQSAGGRSGVLRDATTGTISAAFIELAERDGWGRAYSVPDVRAVAVHEFGHILGLSDHRKHPSALDANIRTGGPTAADREALRLWYSLPPGPACRAAAGSQERGGLAGDTIEPSSGR